jgi:anti-sigma28 factor (negative regulator of flagellin synthesis)
MLIEEDKGMDLAKPPTAAAVVRRMLDESQNRARKLAALREGIKTGSYRVSAARLAEAILRSIES